MELAGTLAFMVIPAVPLIVSLLRSALRPRPLVVSAIVRDLIVMSAPKTVAVGAVVTLELEMITSAAWPGTRAWFAPPDAATQLLWVLPLEAAQTLVAPLRPPFQ